MPSKFYNYKKKSIDKKQNKRISKLEKRLAVEYKVSNDSDFNATDTNGGIGTNTMQVLSAATPFNCGNFQQGDNVGQRTGNKLRVFSLSWTATIKNPNATAEQMRIIIFYWKPAQASPTLASVLNIAAGANQPDPILTPINPVSKANGTLRILYDKTLFLEGTTNANGSRLKVVHFKKRWKNGINYLYTDTAGADMKQGLYYVMGSTANNTYVSQSCQVIATDV